MNTLTYSQRYYYKTKAKQANMTLEQYLNSDLYENCRKRNKVSSIRDVIHESQKAISLDKVVKLNELSINENMLRVNKTSLPIDDLFSYEGGIPVGTNIMCTGDPGVGKTTLLMHTISNLQQHNPNLKCLFISAEMSKIQVYKYMQRFPMFKNLETMFTSDYLDCNMKDVIEQLLSSGYDYVLMDSIVEVLESVKEDNSWSQSAAEKWLMDLCVKHNEAHNDRNCYTTFLLIQQVTKMGVFVGSNKMKHITDAHLEMKRNSARDGGDTYLYFTKNRNGQVGVKFGYQLTNDGIYYGIVKEEEEEIREFELSTSTN